MLLESKLVHVPAQSEIDADLGEYGFIGLKLRVQYGGAAVDAGSPDHGANDPQEDAVDVIANVLHWLADQKGDAERAVKSALMHFNAEQNGEDI